MEREKERERGRQPKKVRGRRENRYKIKKNK